jgi:polygalacturonase
MPRLHQVVFTDDAIFKSGVPWIDVRAFGATGDGQTDDTRAISAAVATIPPGGATLFFPRGSYVVGGSVAIGPAANVTIAGDQAVITQTATYTKTFHFTAIDKIKVTGVSLVGVGTEHNGSSTSYNGVAGLFFEDCADVKVEHCTLSNHAGGSIRWTGSLVDAWFVNNTVTGIGAEGGIKPLDNNSDIAIGNYAATENKNITIAGNDISATCFGIAVTGSDSVIIAGNKIRDLPGQHGIYLSACSGPWSRTT